MLEAQTTINSRIVNKEKLPVLEKLPLSDSLNSDSINLDTKQTHFQKGSFDSIKVSTNSASFNKAKNITSSPKQGHSLRDSFDLGDSYYKSAFKNWSAKAYSMSLYSHWLSLGADKTFIPNSNFNQLTNISLGSGKYIDESNFIQLTGSYGWTNSKDIAHLNINKDIKLYSLYIEFKSFQPSFYPEIIQYFLFGIGVDCYAWNYKSPVEIGYYDYHSNYIVLESIQDDMATAFDLHAGLGFNMADLNGIQLVSEVSPGYAFAGLTTHNDLENTLVKNHFYIKLKLMLYFPYD
jgi:hypothetical protein